jgi:hypothetical protein
MKSFKPKTSDSVIILKKYTLKYCLKIRSISLEQIDYLIVNDKIDLGNETIDKANVELAFSINELSDVSTMSFLRSIELHKEMNTWCNIILEYDNDGNCLLSSKMSEPSIIKYIKYVTCLLNKVDKEGYYIIYTSYE